VDEDIPHKQFYTIGEVSRITGVRPHILRYWESRGKILRPTRRKSRHRLYRPADIQLIFELKRLREEEKMTLPAMQRQLKDQVSHYHRIRNLPTPPAPKFGPVSHPVMALLEEIRRELLDLKELLEEPQA
jgi:DNA-binding transcriptional MerR regulator